MYPTTRTTQSSTPWQTCSIEHHLGFSGKHSAHTILHLHNTHSTHIIHTTHTPLRIPSLQQAYSHTYNTNHARIPSTHIRLYKHTHPATRTTHTIR